MIQHLHCINVSSISSTLYKILEYLQAKIINAMGTQEKSPDFQN